MGHRLFRVEIEGAMFVLAENEREACRMAERHIHDEELDFWAREVLASTRVAEFEGKSLPWGAPDTRTVDEHIAELRRKEEVDRRQLNLPLTEVRHE